MKNEIRELSEAELDLVVAAHKNNRQLFEVDLGNMTISGYVTPGGQTMGVASSANPIGTQVVVKGPA
jgi:hypothetical protein